MRPSLKSRGSSSTYARSHRIQGSSHSCLRMRKTSRRWHNFLQRVAMLLSGGGLLCPSRRFSGRWNTFAVGEWCVNVQSTGRSDGRVAAKKSSSARGLISINRYLSTVILIMLNGPSDVFLFWNLDSPNKKNNFESLLGI